MGQINTNNYPTVSSLADADLLIVENAIHGTGTTTPKQLRENAIGTDTLETTAQTVTGAINEIFEMASDVVVGLEIGKMTSFSDSVIVTDIDLHRAPVAGDRLLVYFDEKITNPTGLKTYNNGVAVTSNLENATPLYINAGWNILEFKNDGLLYNNVWVRKQNVPVLDTLAGMSDTLIVSPSDDQLLVYDNGMWKNKKFVEANVGFSNTELKKIKVGDIVYDTDGLRDYSVSSIANNNITISVLNSNQFVMENIAINTGNHSGSSNGWNLVLTDGMNPVSVALKNADGSPFADDIHENELLFVYVDTAGNIARVLEIHSHDLEILKDAIITEKTATGNPVTVTDALPYNAVSLSAEIEASQDLHGYDHPWAGGAGKNKLGTPYDIQDRNGVTHDIKSDGKFELTGSTTSAPYYCYIRSDDHKITLPVGTYTFSVRKNGALGTGALSGRVRRYNHGSSSDYNDFILSNGAVNVPIINSDDSCSFFLTTQNVGDNVSGVYSAQIELGQTATEWQPYSNICPISGRTEVTITDYDSESNTATVTIQLGQTVYGDTLNVTTGVLTITDTSIDLGSLEWTYNSGDRRFNASLSNIKNVAVRTLPMKCSCYDVIDDGSPFANLPPYCVYNNGAAIAIHDARYTDAESFTTAVTGQTLVYPLAAPQTIQLTPTQLQMLKGYNRVSIDNGTITLTYKADRLAAIEAALAEIGA